MRKQRKRCSAVKSGNWQYFWLLPLQWSREVKRGETESKINVNSALVNQIIPHDFSSIDQEESWEQENKNDKKKIEIMKKELERLRGEKSNQSQLKIIKFNVLLILRQVKDNFTAQEYHDYEKKINTSSREEIEVIEKEILLKIKQKFASRNSKNLMKKSEKN